MDIEISSYSPDDSKLWKKERILTLSHNFQLKNACVWCSEKQALSFRTAITCYNLLPLKNKNRERCPGDADEMNML